MTEAESKHTYLVSYLRGGVKRDSKLDYAVKKVGVMKPVELQCVVSSVKMMTPTVFQLSFTTQSPLEFAGGQFISLFIPGAGPNGRDLRRAYSIASPPELNPIELCIKLVEGGPGTQYLYSLKPGQTFKVMAPYGDFVYKPKPGRQACFVATGTGLAPFRSILTSKAYQQNPPPRAYCLLGVRTENELLYEDVLDHLPGLEFVKAVSQPTLAWKGYKGRVTDYLMSQENFPWLETEYYLCGHGGMINEIKAFLLQKGVAKTSLHQEIYYK